MVEPFHSSNISDSDSDSFAEAGTLDLLIVSPKTRLWFLAHAPDRVRNFWTEKMGWSDALTREVSDDI